MKKVRQCPKCGGNSFFILETVGWKAYIGRNGQVYARTQTNEIESISCQKCDAEFSPRFFRQNQINYN